MLHIAARYGSRDCLEALLKAGGDGNIATANGSTPLHMAVDNNHFGCVEALVNASVDINAHIRLSNLTPLYIAITKGFVDCINLLKINKTNTSNSEFPDDSFLLCKACMEGNVEVVKYMLNASANVDYNLYNSPCHTPLRNAIYNNHSECVEVLTQYNVSINFGDLSAAMRNKDIFEALLKGGAAVIPALLLTPCPVGL